LMLGGLAITGTGVYLAGRRVCSDVVRAWLLLRRLRPAQETLHRENRYHQGLWEDHR
jgi:hypothetical protein